MGHAMIGNYLNSRIESTTRSRLLSASCETLQRYKHSRRGHLGVLKVRLSSVKRMGVHRAADCNIRIHWDPRMISSLYNQVASSKSHATIRTSFAMSILYCSSSNVRVQSSNVVLSPTFASLVAETV